MKKIIVSYRREPDQYVAGQLGRELRRQFGDAQVIRDKESIEGGISWKQYVLNEIDRDSAVLLLIGKGWADATDDQGRRRLDQADDPLRLEVADAFRDGATIIPLLLEDAKMPSVSALPAEIASLAELNALKLRDGDWEADVERLAQRLEKLGFKRGSAPAPAAMVPRSAKAIGSIALAALVFLGLFDGDIDRDMKLGGVFLSLIALGLGAFAIYDIRRHKTRGFALAAAGVVASLLTIAMSIVMPATRHTAAADAPASSAPTAASPAPAPVTAAPAPTPTPTKPIAPVAKPVAPPIATAAKVSAPQAPVDARALLSEFLKPGADIVALSNRLRPAAADYRAVFEPELARKAQAVYDPVWDSGEMIIGPKAGQTHLLLYRATTQELKAWTGQADFFPGGYRQVAPRLNDGVTFYRFKFVVPGSDLGMAYDGLVYVNGNWRIFPKPWRIAE